MANISEINGYLLNADTASYALSSSYAAQARNASTIDINVFGSPVDSYLLMSNVAGTTGVAIGGDADLRYNASTNVLTVQNISATNLTGSLLGTASLALRASGSLTGSLLGTASWATNAVTASRILTQTDSTNANYFLTFVDANNATPTVETLLTATNVTINPFARSLSIQSAVTGGVFLGPLTGSVFGTASWAVSASQAISASRATTSSFAISASWAPSVASNPFPFTGSALITGSLGVTGSTSIRGTFTQGSASSATGLFAHAEGFLTTAQGIYSHTEGYFSNTFTSAGYSHAEGFVTLASGSYSHAEGQSTTSIGAASHAEGQGTTTRGDNSHAEGEGTLAIGIASHAEGQLTTASADYSHTEGNSTQTVSTYQHAQGQFNLPTSGSGAFIIGNGTADNARSNLVFASGSQFQITGSLNVSGSVIITGSLAIGTGSVGNGENNLLLGPAPAGGTGEGGQIALLATGGSYTSSSFLDNYQNQFRILSGPGATSNAGVLAINLGDKHAKFEGAVTASGFNGLPNDYLYVTRNTSQTIGSGTWASRDIIFNNSVVSKGISYNTGTGLASLTAGKVYRITARLAWSAAAAYLLEFSCYDSSNTQLGPTTQIVQATNGSNNISDGTLDFIYAPGSNVDIKIRTTANTTALTGESIRGDLNTQLIIQQIA